MSNILRRLNNASDRNGDTKSNEATYTQQSLMESDSEKGSQNEPVRRQSNPTTESILTPDVKFVGEIEFSKTLTVYGYVKGSIKTNGELYLEEGSEINASINADTLTIKGNFQGNINAQKNIKLLSNAVIEGTLKARSIQVEDGVTFMGEAQISTK